jgi:glyoxylase-like metal-dependent hydrolase (beta-lactamase superfamily II)
MIEEILPDLYKLELPLPKNPLKAISSYLIKAREHSLLIDTGMNREECITVMHSDLTKLNVNLRKTDFFITHFHADHLGLVADLATPTSKVYFNELEAHAISSGSHWQEVYEFAHLNGFPNSELQQALRTHPGFRYGLKNHVDFSTLKEGDEIGIGDYLFTCIETHGHSPGHMCLYEPSKKILVSGDHLLIDITPNIALWSDREDPLSEYLASLDKVYALDVNLVLPGHRGIFNDHRKRILELKHHHQARANEIISILEKGKKNAYEVASQMTWDVTYDSWQVFPSSQKWFAVGETLAHLKYLEERRIVRKEMQGQEIVFLAM